MERPLDLSSSQCLAICPGGFRESSGLLPTFAIVFNATVRPNWAFVLWAAQKNVSLGKRVPRSLVLCKEKTKGLQKRQRWVVRSCDCDHLWRGRLPQIHSETELARHWEKFLVYCYFYHAWGDRDHHVWDISTDELHHVFFGVFFVRPIKFLISKLDSLGMTDVVNGYWYWLLHDTNAEVWSWTYRTVISERPPSTLRALSAAQRAMREPFHPQLLIVQSRGRHVLCHERS